MNARGRTMSGPHATTLAVAALHDAIARVERALEALADGDKGFVEHVLDDLVLDLSPIVEELERWRWGSA
jgi:hypothetical protein